ncbi:hypothetical protein [Paractinoplanes globisporus]|uniref:Uncharacterized protein n=1 Tax=Paractinoplanes globisporus TaxID=113565 RepID=A0ABW6W6T6_9ACTN|nr:hypothetical protein [Actinoplanes globisporus]
MSQVAEGTAKRATGCGCGGGGKSCGCGGGSGGLATFDRPRYFAGQLLTEDELTSEQAYVLAKNRLHNRYLHGWGVVCGLELACGDCPGYVTVRPGYALDPFGNDVVVPAEQQFDLLAAVRACQNTRKRADCDPYAPPQPDPCDGVTEHWCVSLRYEEVQKRPTTALRTQRGNGNGCSCGCGSTKTETVPLGACEPTRVLETFRLGVVKQCEDECPLPVDALRRTFVGQVVTCVQHVAQRLGRLSRSDRQILLAAGFASEPVDASAQQRYEALCRYRQAVRDLLEDEALSTQCTRLKDFDRIEIPRPQGDESGPAYGQRAGAAFLALTALLVDQIRDCICFALMPPCPADPCDDRVILGCVEIRDGAIVEVCGWSGRRYAGSFPALAYWLSFGPALAWAICRLCCAGRARFSRRDGRLGLARLLDSVDPSGSLRRAAYTDDFAAPRRTMRRVGDLVDRLRHPDTWAAEFERLRGRSGDDD